MKRFTILLTSLFLCYITEAQNTSAYFFNTGSTGSLALDTYGNTVSMSSGTTQLVGAGNDNVASSITNIGFTFYLLGTAYTQYSVTSNGVMRLGSTVMSTSTYGNSFPLASVPIIAPYWQNIATGTSGKIHYKLIGSSPNRVLVVEYLNMGINTNSAASDGTFQLRLYETTNVIEFVYGAMSVGSTSNPSANKICAIGISTNTGANYQMSVNQSTYATSISATPITNTNSSTGTITGLNSASNGSRRYFRFTPTPVTSFSYTASAYCAPGYDPVATLATGGQAGTFTSTPSGLSINSSTGLINFAASSPGAYTITNSVTIPDGNGTATSNASVTIATAPTSVSINKNYCLVANKVRLTANVTPSGTYTYLWNTGATTSYIDVDVADTFSVTVSSAGGCSANTISAVGVELVTNSNFDQGNTGFSTGYTYSPSANGLQVEGTYAVNNQASYSHTNFHGTDNTTDGAGTGNFMIVNGSPLAVQPIVWQQTISNLSPGTTYYFSAYALSMNTAGNDAMLRFAVNGTQLGSTASLAPGAASDLPAGTAYPWVRFYGTFVATSTSAVLSVVDLQTATGGNDFGLDDISCSSLGFPGYITTLSVTGSIDTLCAGSSLQLLSSTVGGQSPFTFTWSGPASFSSTVQNPVVSNSVTTAMMGNYTLTVTDSIGCTANGLVNIAIYNYPSAPATSASPTTLCLGGSSSLTGTSAGNTIKWYTVASGGSSIGSVSSGTGYSVTPGSLGTNTYYAEADNHGCASSSRTSIALTVSAAPVSGTLTLTPNTTSVCIGGNVSATATAGSGGTGTVADVLQYRYDGGSWLSYTSGTNLTTTGHTSVDIQTYRTATGTGCTTSSTTTASWTISAQPVVGSLSASPATGTICTGGNVSSTLTAGAGGTGTVTDVLEYRYDGGSWVSYTSGSNLPTSGHTSADIRTYRTATGSDCTTSSTLTKSWTLVSPPASGTLTPTPSAGGICTGNNVSATATTGSGGTGTIADVLQYRLDGGAWTTYTSGTNLATTGHTSIDIQTYRTATGTSCTTSTANIVSWTISAQPVVGSLTASPATGTICTGGNVSATLTAGTGGAGTVTDVLEYRFDGGSWVSYTSGSNLATTGHASADIRTYRTATGSNCTTSSTVTKSWTLVLPPASGTLTPTPSAGGICTGSNVSSTATAGSGGTGTIADVLQYRLDGGSWLTYISGNNIATAGHTSVDIQTYRTSTGTSCTTSTANIVSWTISAQPVVGSLTAAPATGTICTGGNISSTLTAGTGGAGTVTDVLEYRFDGGSWVSYTSGSNLATTGHTSADIRTYRTATGSNCTTSSTVTKSWTLVAPPASGTLTPTPSAGSICTGNNVSAIATAGSDGTGTIADVLQYRLDGGAWTSYTSGTNIATTGHTSIDIQTYRTATGSSCTTSSSNSVTWTISAQPAVGSLTASPATGTICTGGNISSTLTAGTGGAGTVTDVLEYRYDGGSWIAYTSGSNLSTTGHTSVDIRTYRTATGSNCTTSSIVTNSWILVSPPASGTLTPGTTTGPICSGINVSATATSGSGGTGTITDVLQYRYDGGPWVSYTSGTTLTTTGHTSVDIQTYRTSTGTNCTTSSISTVSWIMTAQPVAGSLSASPATGTICSGGNVAATLTSGSGGTGTITDVLEYRFDGGSWISYTSGINLATIGHTSVDIRTYRTATGTNCTTSSINTASWTMTAQPVPGSLSASPATGAICSGGNVSATLTSGSGGTGTITDVLQYRYDGGPWVSYTSGTTLTTTGHTSVDIQTYRTATGAACTTSTANMVSWTISAQPVAGALSTSPSAGTICTGSNVSATLTPGSGGTGTIGDVLEYSFDGGSWLNYTSGNNLATTGHTSIDIRTFRTATGSNCSTSSTTTVSWAIAAQPVAGTLTASPAAGAICTGNTLSATATAGSGGSGTVTDVLQYRYDGGSWNAYTSGTNLNTTGHTSVDIQTYRTATGSNCNTSSINTVSWTISAQPVAGTLLKTPNSLTICTGGNISAIQNAGSGGTGAVTDVLEYRVDGGSWQSYTSGATISSTGHTSVDIRTYRTATGSNCTTSSIRTASWTIVAKPLAGTLTPSPATGNICSGIAVSAVLTAGSGGTGSISDILQYRFDGGSWLTYTSGSNLVTTGHSSVDIRTYRTATGSYCTTSSINTASWTLVAQPVGGTLSGTPGVGAICSGGNVSATLTAGSGGSGTVTDVLEYRYDGGAWTTYTSGSSLNTVGYTSIDIRTYRTATGTNCSTSSTNSLSWTINSQPISGILSGSLPIGAICSGTNIAATLTAGSGGAGTVSDILQYRFDGGSWSNYTSGTNLTTTGHSSVDIQTYRTASGSSCNTSPVNSLSWTITTAPFSSISYSSSQFCMASGTAPVILTGTTGGTFSASPTGTVIDAGTGAIDIPATLNGTYTIDYTVAASGGCAVYTTSTTISVNNYKWTGAINNDWNTSNNWAGGVIPSASCPLVIIPNTVNKPIITSGVGIVNDIQVDSGATLTISNATLQVAGSISSSGAIIAQSGTLELNGRSLQTVNGSMFSAKKISTLINSNSVGVDITSSDTLLITSALLFGTVNNSVTNVIGKLTLLSSDTATARVGEIINGNIISGNITVERYIPVHSKAWQLLCAATKGQSIKTAWQEGASSPNGNPNPGYGAMLTGSMNPATPFGFDVATPGNGSIKVYNDTTALWNSIPSTFAAINNTNGYMLFIRGDRSVITSSGAPTKTILRSTGTICQPSDPPLRIDVQNGKYKSVANPYPSAIDFSQVQKSGGVADIFYLWDPKIAGGYGYGGWQTFVSNAPLPGYSIAPGGGSYSSKNTNIESGSAFLVYAPFSAGTIEFNERCKVSKSNVVTRPGGITDQIQVNLKVIRNAVSQVIDGVLTQVDDNYNNAIDMSDAPKINPTSETICIESQGKLLSIERKHSITQDTILYHLGSMRIQPYQLEVITQDMNDPGRTAFMEDTYLHQLLPVDLNGSTIITFNVTSDSGSYAAKRFRLIFSQALELPVTFSSVTAKRTGKGNSEISWKVNNEINIEKYFIEKSTELGGFESIGTQLPMLNGGGGSYYSGSDNNAQNSDLLYRIRATNRGGEEIYSKIVKLGTVNEEENITIYPNPVTDHLLNISFSKHGIYNVRMYNKLGQEIFSAIVEINSPGVKTLQIPASVAKGSYNLLITNKEGSKTSLSIQIL